MTDHDASQPHAATDPGPGDSGPGHSDNASLRADVRQAGEAILKLGESDPDLAGRLARVLGVVAAEAARTTRFSRALNKALAQSEPVTATPPTERRRRPHRRTPGVIDPFAVFAESGEPGLRARLTELGIEQLRDIVSEHGMDHDRLAMKWKDPQRVVDRILERVDSSVTKGSAFRGRSHPPAAQHAEEGQSADEPPA
ncbi:hypothetical protein [Streptomyces sp. NPDC057702]|uniref:hypothetical protein n=1 Tax=unclassified Streptomyces TaxID=2593676 RepID=UPI0036C283D3